MNPVQQVIWLVENRLLQDMTLAALARETGLSRFILARSFQAATGRTVAQYRRARRLTRAARALAAGQTSVTQAALDAGYAAHEAFTRAFRREFGLTPDALSKGRDLANLNLTEAIRMTAETRTPLTGPEFARLPAMDLIGLTRQYDPGPLAELPAQWAEFTPHLMALPPGRVTDAYGVVTCAARGRPGKITYSCVIPQGLGLGPGGDLTTLRLPAMEVAKFTYRGHISAIKSATGAAFAALEATGRHPAPGVDLIEHYGPDFDPATGFGAYGLWIPVV